MLSRLSDKEQDYLPAISMVVATFKCLQFDLGAETIESKIAYSRVDKMLFMTHGDSNTLQFDLSDEKDGYVKCSDIDGINPICDIDILDIHACNCGNIAYIDDLGRSTCIACEFAVKHQISKVYAWFGKVAYSPNGNYCYSLFGQYRLFYLEQGIVKYKMVISSYDNPFQYGPLEY